MDGALLPGLGPQHDCAWSSDNQKLQLLASACSRLWRARSSNIIRKTTSAETLLEHCWCDVCLPCCTACQAPPLHLLVQACLPRFGVQGDTLAEGQSQWYCASTTLGCKGSPNDAMLVARQNPGKLSMAFLPLLAFMPLLSCLYFVILSSAECLHTKPETQQWLATSARKTYFDHPC